jgi:hypothetical protein
MYLLTLIPPISCGIGISIITPPIGVELCGYGVYLNRVSVGIHDELYTKSIVIQGKDGDKIVLISNDLVGLPKEIIDKAKELINSKTGISKDNILFTCTHTHSGPATFFFRGWGEVFPEYLELLPEKICEAVVNARNNLSPCAIGCGKGYTDIVSYNRVERGGPIDPEIGVIKVESKGEPLVTLFNFACHGVTIDVTTPAGKWISRDWPGYSEDLISSELGGKSVFLQGTTGDIDPVVAWRKFEFEGLQLTGHIVGTEVIKVAKGVKVSEIEEISLRRKEIELPLKLLSLEEINDTYEEVRQRYKNDEKWLIFYQDWYKSMTGKIQDGFNKNTVEVDIALLEIKTAENSCAILFLPGEVFVRLGLEVKKFSPFKNTLIVGYYNEYIGYIPDEYDFERKGYASTVVPQILDTFPYEKDVGKVLLKEIKNILKGGVKNG